MKRKESQMGIKRKDKEEEKRYYLPYSKNSYQYYIGVRNQFSIQKKVKI